MPRRLVRGLRPEKERLPKLKIPTKKVPARQKIPTKQKKPAKSSRLFDLPQELQDMIFDRVCPGIEDLKIIFKGTWDSQARDKRMEDEGYTSPVFPPYKVNEWLISKRYFLAAARTWFGAQKFDFNPNDALSPENSEMFMSQSFGLYEKFATSAHVSNNGLDGMLGYRFRGIDLCQNLKRLTIEQDWWGVESVEGKYAWQAIMDRDDLEDALGVTDFFGGKVHVKALAGIQSLEVVSGYHPYAKTTKQKDLVAANSSLLEDILREQTEQPRPSAESEPPKTRFPLYPGSKVYNVSRTAAGLAAGTDSDYDSEPWLVFSGNDPDQCRLDASRRKYKRHRHRKCTPRDKPSKVDYDSGDDFDMLSSADSNSYKPHRSRRKLKRRRTYKRKPLFATPESSNAAKSTKAGSASLTLVLGIDGGKRVTIDEVIDLTGAAEEWDPTMLNNIIREYIAANHQA